MLKMNLQRRSGSDFGSRAQKCWKWASRGRLGAILGTGPRNVQNEPPEAFWERFWEQGPEMLKMSFQRPPGRDFGSMAQKFSKWISRGGLGAIEGSGRVEFVSHPVCKEIAASLSNCLGRRWNYYSRFTWPRLLFTKKVDALFAFSLNKCISNHVSSMRPRDLSLGLSPNNILILMIQPATNHVTTNHNPHFYTNKSY